MNTLGTLGQRIANARNYKKISQDALAKEIGITKRIIIEYESGKIEPKLSTILKIADACGVSSIWLIFGTNQMLQKTEDKNNILTDLAHDIYKKSTILKKVDLMTDKFQELNSQLEDEINILNLISKIGIDLNQQHGWARLLSVFANAFMLKDDKQQLKAKIISKVLNSLPNPTSPDGAKEQLIDAFQNIKRDFTDLSDVFFATFLADFENRKQELIKLVSENFDDLDAYTFLVRRQQVFEKICEIVGFKKDGIVKQEKLDNLK